MDYYDKREILDAVEDVERRMQHGVNALQDDMRRAEGNQKQMLEAFNEVAAVLKELAEEIKGLRRDLNPELDKPAKLSAPKGATP
ncbi:MAG TPA: hypothetical protein VEF76_09915 [Patescibacteria group bacterium]|nr:hypothetical protein [Patescibacteria group bacterium]